MTEQQYRMIETADEADRYFTDETLSSCLDWFEDERGVPTEEYIDRLFNTYAGTDENGAEIDVERYDNAAASRILSRARRLKRERDA